MLPQGAFGVAARWREEPLPPAPPHDEQGGHDEGAGRDAGSGRTACATVTKQTGGAVAVGATLPQVRHRARSDALLSCARASAPWRSPPLDWLARPGEPAVPMQPGVGVGSSSPGETAAMVRHAPSGDG